MVDPPEGEDAAFENDAVVAPEPDAGSLPVWARSIEAAAIAGVVFAAVTERSRDVSSPTVGESVGRVFGGDATCNDARRVLFTSSGTGRDEVHMF